MTGAVSPACAATSVKWARNGIPEGLPRGRGFTLRGVTPCPRASVDAAVIHKKSRREMWVLVFFIRDRSSVYLSCIITAARKETLVTAEVLEQRLPKPSGSANLPFCCAVLSS